MSRHTGWTRPWTEDRVEHLENNRTVTTIRTKRCCNGCGKALGDTTEQELEYAVSGIPLPDVRIECGCWFTVETDRLIEERDRARATAVALQHQNDYLTGFLRFLRDDLAAGGRTLLTLDDLLNAVDEAMDAIDAYRVA